MTNPYRSGGYLWPSAPAESKQIDLETFLSDAFGTDTPLIGLGEPNEAIGAGRVKALESDWRETLQKLASAATSILVIPAKTEGTRWEIKYLKEHALLEKCIFVMPPSASSEIAEGWQESIGQVPISMPPYDRSGMLYSVDHSGRVLKSADLKVKTSMALVSRIETVSQVPIRQILTYKLSDQPLFRAAAMIGLWPVITIGLGIVLAIVAVIVVSLLR